MAHCYYHALSSVRKWGGTSDDYLGLHQWFDESKSIFADPRHRALRHHAEGIFMLETLFGATITNSDGKVVPVRLIGEQHVTEDLGFIPSFADWGRLIQPQIARRACLNQSWLEPPPRVALFLWTEAGGLVMDELVRRAMELAPDGEGYNIGRIDARQMAEHFMISRTHLQRLFRRAVETGCLHWPDGDRNHCILRRDFLDYDRFLLTIETHGLNTPSKDAWG